MDAVLSDVEAIVVPGLSHWQHPRFFGYFPSNGDLSSVLGDFLSTGLGVLGLSWQSSPALTEVEEVATDWLRQMVGLSDAWSGVIQDTASTSTLVALICARERDLRLFAGRRAACRPRRRPSWSTSPRTPTARSTRPRCSPASAAITCASCPPMRPTRCAPTRWPRRSAPTSPPAARPARSSRRPAPRPPPRSIRSGPIADVAREHGLWLHVDAAMAGSAMILPECRPLWDGIEGADSIVLNPHKWLGVAFDCSVYYVRDAEHLVRVMSTNPSYLRSAVDEQVKNLRDWGIPLGRRFRALKLWFLIREQGVEGLQARLAPRPRQRRNG